MPIIIIYIIYNNNNTKSFRSITSQSYTVTWLLVSHFGHIIRPKHVVHVYIKEKKKSEHQPKLQVKGKSYTISEMYTVQQNAAIW
jgi:hypothetical protein